MMSSCSFISIKTHTFYSNADGCHRYQLQTMYFLSLYLIAKHNRPAIQRPCIVSVHGFSSAIHDNIYMHCVMSRRQLLIHVFNSHDILLSKLHIYKRQADLDTTTITLFRPHISLMFGYQNVTKTSQGEHIESNLIYGKPTVCRLV